MIDEIYEQTKDEHINIVDALREIHDKVYQEAYDKGRADAFKERWAMYNATINVTPTDFHLLSESGILIAINSETKEAITFIRAEEIKEYERRNCVQ